MVFIYLFLSSGNGQLIRPSDLTLGGCEAFDTVDQIVLFQAELHGCGSSVLVCDSLLFPSASLWALTLTSLTPFHVR